MLLTVIEIVAFMAAAALVGVVLGWVLRGAFSREQAEISDLRAQLRKMKKASRESKAEATPAAVASTKVVKADASAKPANSTMPKPASEPKSTAKSRSKKPGSRKTKAEREADQAAGVKAFADVITRVGKSGASDNLTKIHGIGKKYASMLNDMEISSYEQISRLRKDEVRTLAAALGVLDDRLETEDWVGSAKKLQKEVKS